MSIVTKTGDTGTTGLMYNRRVPKTHPRVEAYGCVDELNAALGAARATLPCARTRGSLEAVQRDLVVLMGELATDPADVPRYTKDGFELVAPAMTAKLDALIQEVEPGLGEFHDWVIPGGTPAAAALDLARTICRRAERRACALHEAGQLANPEILIFLNRLADLLWLLARWVEAQPAMSP